MPACDVYSTYHNLWRIEESFRIMKLQLDAFCHLAVLITRIL